ncbi:MAG: OmpH family outer membrane protein [Thermodesulfobacteriota bacterium]
MKKAMTILLAGGLTLVLTLALSPVPVAAQDQVKIGVFDLQTAINQSKKGQAAKAKIVKKFERINSELKAREAEIEKMKQDLERQAAMLSPEARYEKEKELRKRYRDLQDMMNDYNQELKKEEMEVTKPVVEGLLNTASELGKQKGYTLILELQKSGVLWIPPEHNLTEEVIKIYDAK